jgi:hypothetical protein
MKFCKILNRIKKETKRQHYCRLIAKSDKETKTTWNILVIKHERGKLHLTEQIPSLLMSQKSKDPETIANAFSTFF